MMDVPALSLIFPEPGLVWAAAGLPVSPGSVAARRVATLFSGPIPDSAATVDRLRDARDVTILPALEGSTAAFASVLLALRAAAPEAVLRLEWWLEAGISPDAYVSDLRAVQPLFVHALVTKPEQLDASWVGRVRRLLTGGIPVAAEIVLRRGSIERSEAVRTLCLDLLKQGVRPYVLVDGAWLPEAERVPRDTALEIVRGLRGWISGLAVPQLVEESRDGVRRPVIPAYIERLDESGVEVVNFEGRRLRYANPPKNEK